MVAEAVHDRGVLGEDDSGRRGLKCGIVLLGQVYMGSEIEVCGDRVSRSEPEATVLEEE